MKDWKTTVTGLVGGALAAVASYIQNNQTVNYRDLAIIATIAGVATLAEDAKIASKVNGKLIEGGTNMNVAIALLPALIQLMGLAEGLFKNTPKSGAQKKEMVMNAASIILGTLQTVSTGGQRASWERIAPAVSTMIDAASTIAFPSDKSEDGVQPPTI